MKAPVRPKEKVGGAQWWEVGWLQHFLVTETWLLIKCMLVRSLKSWVIAGFLSLHYLFSTCASQTLCVKSLETLILYSLHRGPDQPSPLLMLPTTVPVACRQPQLQPPSSSLLPTSLSRTTTPQQPPPRRYHLSITLPPSPRCTARE